jgi:hypothetical protein
MLKYFYRVAKYLGTTLANKIAFIKKIKAC